MRNTVQLAVAAAAAVALACGEGTAPSSQQTQVLAAEQEQLGAMVDTDFGAAGATATDAAPAGAGLSADLAATPGDTAPSFWGRLRVVRSPARRVHNPEQGRGRGLPRVGGAAARSRRARLSRHVRGPSWPCSAGRRSG